MELVANYIRLTLAVLVISFPFAGNVLAEEASVVVLTKVGANIKLQLMD